MTGILGAVAAAAVRVAQVARKLLFHRNLELQGIARLPRPDNDATLEIPVRRGIGVGLGAELQVHGRARPAQDHAVVEVAGRSLDKSIVQCEVGVDAEPLGDREIIPVAAADRAGSLRQQDRSRRGLRIGGHVHIGRTTVGRAVAGHGEFHVGITHAGALVGKHPANRFARGGIDEFEMPIGIAGHIEGQHFTVAGGGQALLLNPHPADAVHFRIVGAGSPGSQQSRRRAYP